MGLMTFKNLPKEKRLRILNAAKKEFSRVPLNKALISNIVKEAQIPRGSFYQYFDSIEQLFLTLLHYIYGREHKTFAMFLEHNNHDLFLALKQKFAYTIDRLNDENRQFNINIFNAIISDKNKNILPSLMEIKVETDNKFLSEIFNDYEYSQEILNIIEMINLTCISKYLINNEQKDAVKEAYNRYIDSIKFSFNNLRKKNEATTKNL